MTPKEKAIELVDKFENIVPTIDGHYSYQEMIEEHFNKSKQCALIVVDDILNIGKK
jgi:Cdc6-like AAA superfamily ATPase